MTTPASDKIFLATGGILFAGACAWAFMQQGQLTKLEGRVTVPSSGAAYTPEPLPAASISEAQLWPQATSLPRGPNWIYDVFTPPVIYYNKETKQFTVTPPIKTVIVVEVEKPPVPFGLNLVKVVQYPFPLQLVGYVGTGADARGNFLNEQTGETILGTTGKKIPSLNMEIVKFSAEVIRETIDGQLRVYTVASARVRDLKTGKETELSNTKRLIEADPAVVVQVDGEGSTREFKAGESFTVGDYTYNIVSIQTEANTATVTKSGGELPEPETKTLTDKPVVPVEQAAPAEPATESTSTMPEGFFPSF